MMYEILATLISGGLSTFLLLLLLRYLPPKDSEEVVGCLVLWLLSIVGMHYYLTEVFG